jgi:DNA-binding NarL/FixJ family response regulator
MGETRGTAVICDDDANMRHVLTHMLDDAGFDVVGEVANAVEAIDVVRFLRPDVIVLDVSLAGLSGVDALPALREASPDSQVVVCTAFGASHNKQVEAGGAVALLDKADLSKMGDVLAGVRTRPARSSTSPEGR